jgi:hypothetical protein
VHSWHRGTVRQQEQQMHRGSASTVLHAVGRRVYQAHLWRA